MDTMVPQVKRWFDVTNVFDLGGVFIAIGLVTSLIFLIYFTRRFKYVNKRMKPDLYQEIRWWLKVTRSFFTATVGWMIIKVTLLLLDFFT